MVSIPERREALLNRLALSEGRLVAPGRPDEVVSYGETVSCYDPDTLGRACGACDSCRIRREGFAAAGVPDPTAYR